MGENFGGISLLVTIVASAGTGSGDLAVKGRSTRRRQSICRLVGFYLGIHGGYGWATQVR